MFSFDERVIPLDVWITNVVNWLVEGYRWFFQLIKWPVDFILSGVSDGLLATSPLLVIALFGAIAWRVSGLKLAIFTLLSLVLIGLLGFWSETMITLAMVFSSVVFCTLVGVPFGIWAGRSDRVNNVLRPILDAMQTTPAFVYLVPIVMLFSIGNTAVCWQPSFLPCHPW